MKRLDLDAAKSKQKKNKMMNSGSTSVPMADVRKLITFVCFNE